MDRYVLTLLKYFFISGDYSTGGFLNPSIISSLSFSFLFSFFVGDSVLNFLGIEEMCLELEGQWLNILLDISLVSFCWASL